MYLDRARFEDVLERRCLRHQLTHRVLNLGNRSDALAGGLADRLGNLAGHIFQLLDDVLEFFGRLQAGRTRFWGDRRI